ncbi:flavin-dependent oxidoreductase [Leucobacter sp. wl10]|uniref:flavin-dependent oxidoreductase n=1 Tax=Leucobacter sp. wl10 TaxID=2304677 RepID=UPI000E5A7F0A|nr:flavin-dependent oxidoreductase [Leucobacter sp. wl10]RGE18953.1 flavin-dependent oxidoreductase [Leucobacter sp. wl10]
MSVSWDRGVLVVGAGIGGLTLALQLHRVGVPFRVIEAAPWLEAIGVGVNILPHASRELHELGLGDALDRVAIRTREARYYNRFGQAVHTEPLGAAAGYRWPQYSIHRGDLQGILLDALSARAGTGSVQLGTRLVGIEQHERGVRAAVETRSGPATITADVVVGCDGVHSAVRRELHPGASGPVYSGCTMWRGATLWPPFLGGAALVRAGWLASGKMVIYPIRDDVDGQGNQLINWVAEIETPQRSDRSWNREGSIDDIIEPFSDWNFDWLDVPGLMRATGTILEYPMVDQEPLERWTSGRATLLGDAAHPMVPRGSNGAGQAILDTRALARALAEADDPAEALLDYESQRREATSRVVLQNRRNPPDAILREVYERTGDRPFSHIEDVMPAAERERLLESYRAVAGYSLDDLARGGGGT